jgi:VWFA-related protein
MCARLCYFALPLVLAPLCMVNAQTTSSQGPTQTKAAVTEQNPSAATLHSVRREVLVDMVVRDKHRKLITDLRPDEVQVYENGVLQRINDFRNVQGTEELETEQQESANTPTTEGRASSANPVTTAPKVTPLHQMNFVAVVFANVAPLNLEFAREAVLDFLNSGTLPNTYVSIYRLNHSLRIVQFYSANKDVLAKAVDAATKGINSDDGLGVHARVTGSAYSVLQAAADNILSSPRLDQTTAMAVRNALLNPIPIISQDPLFARDAASQDASFELGNAIITQAHIENGIRFASSLSNGMDVIDSLREIVRSQERLPGRKVVLYLSDGLEFPMNRRDAVGNLISYANRSGVSFYGIDTRGLNVEDPMMSSLAELERTAAISSAQKSDPRTGHKEDDTIALTAVSNKQLALRELAESTGGFVVTDTNEIAAPMKRIMEDIRFHYEIAYTPIDTTYDGHFRKIEVVVARKHVHIQTRKGYFALPDLNGQPLQPFEAEALSAINGRDSANRFPYDIAVMRFRPGQEAVEHQIAFEVPLSDFRTASIPNTGKWRIKAALVAIIRNAKGEVVGKVSRELVRDITDSRPTANERILYVEPIELPGGHYEVDSAVTDEESGKTSVKRLAFFVDSGKDFGLSSLELVRQSHPTSDSGLDGGNLPVDPNHLLPVLSDSLAPGTPMDLYFVIYPAKVQSGEDPKVVLQVLHNGREIARQPLKLPRPEPDGSVPIVLKLSPKPGQCDILVTAQQGTLVAQSALSVKVE